MTAHSTRSDEATPIPLPPVCHKCRGRHVKDEPCIELNSEFCKEGLLGSQTIQSEGAVWGYFL
jgi:hypothetical protein